MDTSMFDPELLEGFFLDVEETFSPQVAQGMELARQGDLSTSVDMMLRPLHTIKGTAAFLGLDAIASYAHAVEDLLKGMQSGAVQADPAFMMRCVDMVFHVLERAREGTPLEGAGHEELAVAIRNGNIPKASSCNTSKSAVCASNDDAGIVAETREGVLVLQPQFARIHLPRQAAPLLEALRALPDGSPVLLDLTQVRTINSTTWGALWVEADRLDIHAACLGAACQGTFHSWGFAARITPHDAVDAFWQSRKESS